MKYAIATCYRSGGAFDGRAREYVERLFAGCRRHCSIEAEYYVLTDRPGEFEGLDCAIWTLETDLPGWHCKFEAFGIAADRVLLLDLDCAVVGDPAPLLEAEGVELIEDLRHPGKPQMGYACWSPDETLARIPAMAAEMSPPRDRPDTLVLLEILESLGVEWRMSRKGVASWKDDIRDGFAPPPEGTWAVMWHGSPRPHEVGWWIPPVAGLAEYRDRHAGESCVILGTGPTLEQYRDPEPVVRIGLNTAAYAIDLDYLMIQDQGRLTHPRSYISDSRTYDELRPRCGKLYGVSLSPLLKARARRAGATAYEFTANEIVEIDGHRVEDPESVPDWSADLSAKPPAAGGSVAFPALQFALWCGFKRIYLAGMDVTDPRRIGEGDSGNDYARFLLPRWEQFAEWVSRTRPGVSIVSVNPVGLRGLFDDLDLKPKPSKPPKKSLPRLHMLAPPNTGVGMGYEHCAFTSKVEKYSPALAELGWDVTVYSHENSDVGDLDLAPCMDDRTLALAYGGQYVEGGWKKKIPKCVVGDPCHRRWTEKAIEEIRKRWSPQDFLMCWYGVGSKAACQPFKDGVVIEPSIGTFRVFAPWRCYETQHIRSFVEGSEQADVRRMHTVIHPGLDPAEFDVRDPEDYWLFLGRLDEFKGADTAIELAERTGIRLVVAGQGRIEHVWPRRLPPNVEFAGYADRAKKRTLLSGAIGLLMPTKIHEPCGWTAIEAQMSGVPVVCPDHGGLTETVLDGVTGWRCRTLYDYEAAISRIGEIDRSVCRRWAEQNFNVSLAAERYDMWLRQIRGVYTGNDYRGSDVSMATLGMRRIFT